MIGIEVLRLQIIESRKGRKLKRAEAENHLSASQIAELNTQLSKESVAEKNQLKALKSHWQQELELVEIQLKRKT